TPERDVPKRACGQFVRTRKTATAFRALVAPEAFTGYLPGTVALPAANVVVAVPPASAATVCGLLGANVNVTGSPGARPGPVAVKAAVGGPFVSWSVTVAASAVPAVASTAVNARPVRAVRFMGMSFAFVVSRGRSWPQPPHAQVVDEEVVVVPSEA